MARSTSPHPTDTELEILQVLWESGPSSLSHVCATLRQSRPVATTTVSTMLKVMQEKKLVRRQRTGQGARGSKWQAGISRSQAARGFVSKMIDRIFDGSTQQLVAHIVSERTLTDADRESIQQLLDETAEDET